MKLTQLTKVILISGLTFTVGFSILYLINNFNYRENYEDIKKVYPLKIDKDYKITELVNKAVNIYHKYNYINNKLNEFNISNNVKNNIMFKITSIYTNIFNTIKNDITELINNTPNDEIEIKIQSLLKKGIKSFNEEINIFNKILLSCSSAEEINKLKL